ncbi:hypothetical protein SSBR45G_11170 [Bradyrhizobium sp. SSBR45G]|uniref:DUF1963 domain-containing protein n=1 Tax=unclassified Bradyrhizobium TaxID=2631580 RepID=UPI002342A3B6|nr:MULTISPECIES: DUF1963 domain-containing protein [unclassified Bradyrhizobium]GLH76209.1 hypothetical protein SSBR45G_11170 [Bradyrhizobium sp. SSBR45G]GLH83307.1 hypothetical protein SSBR45R_07670 [Bradyrhizobium sp. SSBR45R]
MGELERLRADLYAAVRNACLEEARELADGEPDLPLPTEAAIDEFSRWISTSAAPVANMRLAPQTQPFALGASRLIAAPDMPDRLAWPSHNGQPLAFLAQIDLSTLPGGIDWPVPRRGWIYFFLGTTTGSIEEGDPDASPNRTLFFNGDRPELRPRQLPQGITVPNEFKRAVPYSVSFELGLSVPMGNAGEIDTPWYQVPGMDGLDLGDLLLDRTPQIIPEDKSRMFGLPRNDQINDAQVEAASTMAEYAAATARKSLLERMMAPFRTPKPQPGPEQEAKHWCSLLSIGYIPDQFRWGDAQTYRVLVDERKARAGDFSQTFIYVSD